MGKLTSCRQAYFRDLFRTVEVTDDLSSVTDVDISGEVDPRQVDIAGVGDVAGHLLGAIDPGMILLQDFEVDHFMTP